MSEAQHKLARQLLSIIRDASATHRLLTYQTAAEELGRPKNNARAIAQVCDLLDAAAALARVPLLALVAVRMSSGKINPKAWVKGAPAGIRESVIRCSLHHDFTADDFGAINKALLELSEFGNRSAWAKVRRTIPDRELFRILTTDSHYIAHYDAINDLEVGSDSPQKETTIGSRYARDPEVRKRVLVRADGECELCGRRGFFRPDGTIYLETHHIIALAKDGADRETNVIGLCPDHHREAHFGASRDHLEGKMIIIVKEKCKKQILYKVH